MPIVLLCHFDGTNGSTSFTDDSGLGHTLTSTNVTVSTTSPKFGTGSGDFSAGGNASISAGVSSDFNFDGQFTVEAWVYFLSAPSGVQSVMAQFGGSSNYSWFFGPVGGELAFYYSLTGSDNPHVGVAYSPTLNTWIHLAADRDVNNVLRVYANGAVMASATVSGALFNSTRACLIGNDENLVRNFPGRLDEARIIKGVAQYGGAFAVPTASFPSGTLKDARFLARHV